MDCCVGGGRYYLYYSYCRNPMRKEFFVPAGTLIAVKLLMDRGYLVMQMNWPILVTGKLHKLIK